MENFKNEFIGLKKNGERKMSWLRTKDLKAWLNVGDSTVQEWRIKGYLKSYKVGRMHFFLEDDVNEMIKGGKNTNYTAYGI